MFQAGVLFKKKFKVKYVSEKYLEFIKNNTAAGIDRVTKKTFDISKAEQINLLVDKSLKGTYKYTYYKEKLILKNRNSLPRLISIPTIRDRIVLKLLHEILMDTFEIRLELVQTVISSFIKKANKYDAYIKIDISNFFGSLDHQYLMKQLKKKIRKAELLKLIQEAILNPTVNSNHRKNSKSETVLHGVPQGVPIANVLAEIYFKEIDKEYQEMGNIAYFRYVDDILILCDSTEVNSIKETLIKELTNPKKMNLKVNEDKTIDGLLKEGMNYLGYQFEQTNGEIICKVKTESLLKLENALVALFTKYKSSHGKMKLKELIFYLNLKITGAIIEDENGSNKKYGWLFFYSQINDINKLYHLDNFLKKLLVRYKVDYIDVNKELKSFVKAYYEITQRRAKSKYIYKPSELTLADKRKLLNETFSIHKNELLKEESVNYLFYKKVYKKVYELEMDIQDAY